MKKNNSYKLTALALALFLTSCSSNDKINKDYKNNAQETVEAIVNSREFYQIPNGSQTFGELYHPFYQKYIGTFINYLNEEQYNDFLNIIRIANTSDSNTLNKHFAYLDMLMGAYEDTFGRGIYHAFNTRLVYESLFPAWMMRDETYKEINTLRQIVNNDEQFFRSLFSEDIDNFIDCIIQNTGFENRTLIEELVQKFDLYTDIEYSEEINEIALRESYKKRIEEIMSMIVQSKLANYEDFRNTLYGKILEQSKYVNDCGYDAYQDILEDRFEFSAYNSKASFNVSIPTEYLYSDKEISELKSYKVTDIISNASDRDATDFYKNAMNLMIILVDSDLFKKSSPTTADTKRELMYENLSEYFESIEDFDDFFLSVASGSSTVMHDYFYLVQEIISKNGITHDDFLKFTALKNLSLEEEYIYFDWQLDREYPPYAELCLMDIEEAKRIVTIMPHSYLFDGIDYDTYFDVIEQTLKDNNLGYEMIYSPQCRYDYSYGVINVQENSTSVLSSLVEPKMGLLNGTSVIYYEIPELYTNGRAVEAFTNIEKKLTLKNVEGIKEEFFDEISGELVSGFITDVNATEEDLANYKPIRFIEFYKYFIENKNTDTKKLTLGDGE